MLSLLGGIYLTSLVAWNRLGYFSLAYICGRSSIFSHTACSSSNGLFCVAHYFYSSRPQQWLFSVYHCCVYYPACRLSGAASTYSDWSLAWNLSFIGFYAVSEQEKIAVKISFYRAITTHHNVTAPARGDTWPRSQYRLQKWERNPLWMLPRATIKSTSEPLSIHAGNVHWQQKFQNPNFACMLWHDLFFCIWLVPFDSTAN